MEQVFFIRDGIQFVDLVHCLRPNPKTNIQEGWRILDFLSHHPESVHIVGPCLAQPVHLLMLLLCFCPIDGYQSTPVAVLPPEICCHALVKYWGGRYKS